MRGAKLEKATGYKWVVSFVLNKYDIFYKRIDTIYGVIYNMLK